MSLRIALTTGGTGGHIFPALAVAEELRSRGADLLFIGSAQGPEGRLATQAGLDFRGLPVHGVLGRGLAAVGALARLAVSVPMAMKLLRSFQPQAVVGFGAYASAAPLAAARLMGIPLALHEQNAMPGLTNRLLGKLADRVFLSLPVPEGSFPSGRTCLTGNPVRRAIAACGSDNKEKADGEKHLLIMGGSQGARAVNSVILANLPQLAAAGVRLRHQSGERDLERVRAGYLAHGLDVSGVTAFIEDMAAAYAWADLVLCRAGATSVAELAAAGKPAVFVPFPHATHDHQTSNARAMEQAGAALLVPEAEIPRTDVGGLLLGLLADPERLKRMGEAARGLARTDAASTVAEGIVELASRKAR